MGLSAAARSAAQSFDRTAADYDRLGDLSENDSIRGWLVSVLPPAGGRALDLGCGAGRHAVLLAGRFTHVDAVDLSLPMIEIARAKRSRPNVAYQQADLLETTGSGEYDLVLSVMTLHHVPDLQAALAHIKDCWRREGGSCWRTRIRRSPRCTHRDGSCTAWSRSGRGCTRWQFCASAGTSSGAARPPPGRSTGCTPAASGSITA
jgi:2-polyprenyl-3-methyl-5-hydroxy-6-metoxy-1,4-benzoquinol methylase